MIRISSGSRRAAILLLVTVTGALSALGCGSSGDDSSSPSSEAGTAGTIAGGGSSNAGTSSGGTSSAGTSSAGSANGGTTNGGTNGAFGGTSGEAGSTTAGTAGESGSSAGGVSGSAGAAGSASGTAGSAGTSAGTGGAAGGSAGTSAGGSAGTSAGSGGAGAGTGGSAGSAGASGGSSGAAGSGGTSAGSGGSAGTSAGGSAGTSGSAGSAGSSGGSGKIVINEVESNGGDPGDWCELYNVGTAPIDISGYVFRDNKDSDGYVIPNGTIVQPGAYYVLEVADFVFGLGAPDMTRLFLPDGTTPVDSYSWDTHAVVTYGRCPNGTGDFVDTAASTKGAANSCPTGGGGSGGAGGTGGSGGAGGASGGAGGTGGTGGSSSAFAPWPGPNPDVVSLVDNASEFAVNLDSDTTLSDGTNVSGLFYEPSAGGDVMWAVQNGPPRVYRLLQSGGLWVLDTANNWADGHEIHYKAGGTGQPDSEGITKAAFGTNFVYVSTERDNTNKNVSKPEVLRVDDTATTRDVNATDEWDLSSEFNLPAADANLGLEAIAWVPDSYLTANGFFDEAMQSTYDPNNYPNHAGGIFFVGLEATGMIYGYALNHTDDSFTRVAAFAGGLPTANPAATTTGQSIMDLSFDRENDYLWAVCDDTCNGRTNVFVIDTAAASPTKGHFIIKQGFERPSTMPNINNEGFTVTPEALCNGGFKPVYYSDDTDDNSHALRSDAIPCGPFLNP